LSVRYNAKKGVFMKITNVTSPPTSVSIYENWDGPGADDI